MPGTGCGTGARVRWWSPGTRACAVITFSHQPVLLAEVLAALRPRDGGRYFDGCCGGAGHSAAILEASGPTGFLYACDQDGDAVAAATEDLARYAGRFELRRMNFSEADRWAPPGTFDGALLDLGVSSHQLDTAERGFSFQADGPLDMRMDRRCARTAADLVNDRPPSELAQIFWEYGDERESRRIARAICEERTRYRIESTRQLASLVARIAPRQGRRTHPATRVFQALRIAVNDELGALQRGLRAAMTLLKPGGRLAVISFHSLEDRVVKEFMRVACRDYDLPPGTTEDLPHLRMPRAPRGTLVARKPVRPADAEVESNPRARSAQLRVLEKN
ncbi:MAG: 16S rRNA (cytosine(1402)-N(4))-methyltransferase RsmH [Verrucomicrobia bacterium]|nr:16S rRNA (cytosine(1402)-N(4))-methyltransferase RsmH [Verrucomicrobiota bacterium]